LVFLRPKISKLLGNFCILKTKNFKPRKLNGAIIGTGINLAYFASIPAVIKTLSSNVLTVQKIFRLNRYLTPDFE
jgi:hypothetical protein